MPQRSNIVGDLGTTKVASDAYDIDNIYLTEEGWVYRHYKKTDKSKWWDEIIVAGEVVAASNAPCEATNPPKLGTVASPTFETGGDTYKDFEYSTQTATGGGVPTLDDGSGGGGGGGGGGGAPATGPVTGVTLTNTATTQGDGAVVGQNTVTTGNGLGLTVDYDVSGGVISNIAVNAGGSGYAAGDDFTIVGTGGTAEGTVSI